MKFQAISKICFWYKWRHDFHSWYHRSVKRKRKRKTSRLPQKQHALNQLFLPPDNHLVWNHGCCNSYFVSISLTIQLHTNYDDTLSIYPSFYPFIHLSICLSIIDRSVYLFVHLSVRPSVCPSVHLSVLPSICLSIRPFVHLSIHVHTVIVISCSISMVSTVVNLESGTDVPMSRINKSIVTAIKMTIRRIQSLIAWI